MIIVEYIITILPLQVYKLPIDLLSIGFLENKIDDNFFHIILSVISAERIRSLICTPSSL